MAESPVPEPLGILVRYTCNSKGVAQHSNSKRSCASPASSPITEFTILQSGIWTGTGLERIACGETYFLIIGERPTRWLFIIMVRQLAKSHISGSQRVSFEAISHYLTKIAEEGCAWIYPTSLNGQPGHYADPYANDQDWVLNNLLPILDERSVNLEQLSR